MYIARLLGCTSHLIRIVYKSVGGRVDCCMIAWLHSSANSIYKDRLINGLASHTYERRVAWVVEGGLMHEWSDFIDGHVPPHGLVVQLELFDGARLSFGGDRPLTRQTAFASPGVW